MRAGASASTPTLGDIAEREVLSFAELYPPVTKGVLLGTIDDPYWRRMWDMASADGFAMA